MRKRFADIIATVLMDMHVRWRSGIRLISKKYNSFAFFSNKTQQEDPIVVSTHKLQTAPGQHASKCLPRINGVTSHNRVLAYEQVRKHYFVYPE